MNSGSPSLEKKGFRFAFDSSACTDCSGNCCSGVSGYVWVTEGEIWQLARLLKLTIIDFRNRYTRRIDNRISLTEQKIGQDYPCIFFDLEANRCSVYESRPEQCRTYPFWKENRFLIRDLTHDCPGIKSLSEDDNTQDKP